MPFGLQTAPDTFQRLMSMVLRVMSHFSLAYLDDMIIFSPSIKEYMKHINLVFDQLREHNLKMKIFKVQIYAVRNPVPRIYC